MKLQNVNQYINHCNKDFKVKLYHLLNCFDHLSHVALQLKSLGGATKVSLVSWFCFNIFVKLL